LHCDYESRFVQDKTCVFELTYNWGQDEPYDKGEGYAQVAIGTDDVYKTAEVIRANGGTITKEPQEISSIGTRIMATTDPDGWKVVFVQNEDFLKELE
jgi:lactoylglutathione lyase